MLTFWYATAGKRERATCERPFVGDAGSWAVVDREARAGIEFGLLSLG